ncbi:MAG: magnesium chelatase subunit H [Candidatus Viridilinea halotolerans]|uniref:magnesium chelatase n=1 Tax=Candidatus Viridilinea halotolerans TaxID=2491704 RepID=A0A426TSW3_9CHLR|nr:MAG: magnesium chelatase subunit H [Candidatus Viridilinea halotolerans]
MRVVFLSTQDNYTVGLRAAAAAINREYQLDLQVAVYMAADLGDPVRRARIEADVVAADVVVGAMLFGEAYVRPLEAIFARATCPMAIIMSNPALAKFTRLGKFTLSGNEDAQDGHRGMMNALRPKHGHGEASRQLALVKNLTRILKYLPGRMRDLHTFIVLHQFWVHNSPDNLRRMLCLLVERYVPGMKGRLPVEEPFLYPDLAIWHPDAPAPFADLKSYEKWQRKRRKRLDKGVVGLLTLRVIALCDNVAHLTALIRALEARGIEARLAYSAALDNRPALEAFFSTTETSSTGKVQRYLRDLVHRPADGAAPARRSLIDLLVTTSGFALAGGMAQSRPKEANEALDRLDVPFLQTIPLVFQRVEQWRNDDRGLSPMHLAMNVALSELEGATEPLVYGGPAGEDGVAVAIPEQIERFADRVARRVALGRKPNSAKKVALVLFNFPPNMGGVGTAAYLDVFASVYRLLQELHAQGYYVELPESADALRRMITEGNALVHGTDGNVAATLNVDEYRRIFPDYVDIEPFWGAAPGDLLSDGKRLLIQGRQFGHIFIGIQPTFGYERDPMRMLMARDAAPHHGFAAFYAWLDRAFAADAVVHIGTHGALEFMPGKQAGLGPECWPARLLGALPNIYYYCVNNPSEGTIAKRRGAATLVSYLVPPVQQAGLYKGLLQLKDSIQQYQERPDPELLAGIYEQAERLGVGEEGRGEEAGRGEETEAEAGGREERGEEAERREARRREAERREAGGGEERDDAVGLTLARLSHRLLEVEQRLIPVGLHVLGQPPAGEELVDILSLVATFNRPPGGGANLPELIAAGMGFDYAALCNRLSQDSVAQAQYRQVDAACRAAVARLVAGEPLAVPGVAPDALAPIAALLNDLLARLRIDGELPGLLRALGGGFIPASPGNDIVRNPAVVPTGRNIHGLDPYRMPSEAAQVSGTQCVHELLEGLRRSEGAYPETVALVLWGTDNLKTGGEGVAQALALIGARPVIDELGKIADVALIPLAELGRPRIDVVCTVSGIFRDLMAHQAMLIDKAARLAAAADEPEEANFVRKHARSQAVNLDVSLDEAAARVFSNAPGSYGANVNHMVEQGNWEDDSQLGDVFMTRKGFALDANGEWYEARPLLEQALSTVQATFQNVDSVETGISDVDHYYEYLGGVTKSVEKLRGTRPKVMVAEVEAFSGPGSGRVRSLEQIVRLESRAKLLNPKWFEGMLAHGYEGAHEIEVRLSNTYGWSATANAVDGWVYQGVADTYLLDEAMRERLAQLNPQAAAGMARRLLEASERGFWEADEATLEQLRGIYADLEDRMEGVR